MRILLLRSSGVEDGEHPEGIDVVVTHEVAPVPDGIAEAIAFPPQGAALVVSSRTTVRVLDEASRGDFFGEPFAVVLSVGGETGKALERAGARGVRVPAIPGAAGILAELPVSLDGARILWPRASDADTAPLAELVRRGAQVAAPVVYEKRPRRPEPEILARLLSGKFDAIAVSSLAALDALVVALEGVPLPPVIWGAIGPESARQLIARGLPRPVVPLNPTIAELVEALRESG